MRDDDDARQIAQGNAAHMTSQRGRESSVAIAGTRRRFPGWIGALGCATILSVVVIAVVRFGRVVVWVGVAVAGVLIGGAAYNRYRRNEAIRRFTAAYPAKDVLITYSNSPNWQTYIEREWLPRAASRAVAFNRSLPWSRDEPHARLWIAFTGRREHTPSIIVLRAHAKPAVIGFFSAFRDYKHGNVAALREAESRVRAAGLDLDRAE